MKETFPFLIFVRFQDLTLLDKVFVKKTVEFFSFLLISNIHEWILIFNIQEGIW